MGNLTVGIDLGGRTITSSIPAGTQISSLKYIAKAGPNNYIAEDSNSGYIRYIDDNSNEVITYFYDLANNINLASFDIPEGFGAISEIDESSVLYEYLTRIEHEKVYLVTEDNNKVEGMSKEEINTEFSSNCITAKLSTNTVTVPGDNYYIPLNESVSVGNKLTLNNDGEIIIGAGISKVKVSGYILSGKNVSSGGTWRLVSIYHYSRTLESSHVAKEFNYNISDNMITVFPPVVIDVVEGDRIFLVYAEGQGDSIIGGNLGNTYLTVEAIN